MLHLFTFQNHRIQQVKNYHFFDVCKILNIIINNLINMFKRTIAIDLDGDVELYVTDTYDFNKGERTGAPAVGRDRLEKGEIKPYFEIYHVVIPKDM